MLTSIACGSGTLLGFLRDLGGLVRRVAFGAAEGATVCMLTSKSSTVRSGVLLRLWFESPLESGRGPMRAAASPEALPGEELLAVKSSASRVVSAEPSTPCRVVLML